MTVLNLNRKVIYNPNLDEHRKAYKKFVKTGQWKHTNLRFEVEAPYLDVPTTLQNKTLKYYMQKDKV